MHNTNHSNKLWYAVTWGITPQPSFSLHFLLFLINNRGRRALWETTKEVPVTIAEASNSKSPLNVSCVENLTKLPKFSYNLKALSTTNDGRFKQQLNYRS